MGNDNDLYDEREETVNETVLDKIIDLADITALFSVEKLSAVDQTLCTYYKNLLENQRNDLEHFVNKLYNFINDIFNRVCGDVTHKSTEPKVWTQYYSEVYKFSTSQDYISLVKCISHCDPTNRDFEVCSKIFDKVSSIVLQKHSDHLITAHDTSCDTNIPSESGKGKLRYIFGRCIAKCRFHHMKYARTNMYKKQNRESVSRSFIKVKMLDSLTTSYAELIFESKYKETLVETQRKQNLSQGLTNIKDSTFEFMAKVDEKRLLVQHEKLFNLYGSDFLSHCHTVLLKDVGLYDCWRNLFHSFDYSESYLPVIKESAEICLHELFEDIIKRFCRIAENLIQKRHAYKNW